MKKHLLISVFGAFSFCYQMSAFAAPYIRYEAHSVQGKKAVASMEKALTRLKALGCDKPVSWYYQAAIHGVPDPSKEGDLASNPLCSRYSNSTKPLSTWSKCASHVHSGSPSDIHFLPWHRLYINHFEKIIRKYSGDTTFALPYWDYEKYPTLPDRFRASANGSLYEPARLLSLNKGSSISSSGMVKIRDESAALSEVHDYETYNSQLNYGLHDFLHDYIGGAGVSFNRVYNQYISAGLMGNVPSAAFDSIFWLHHANIDRLWQNWMIANPGQNVTLGQLNSVKWPYRFAQDNGLLISYTMAQVLATTKTTDFVYDTQITSTTVGKAIPARLIEHAVLSIPLDAVTALGSPANILLNLNTDQQSLIKTTDNKRVILTLDTAYTGKPNGRYEVHVNLPQNIAATNVAAKQYFAGAIAFFVNDPKAEGGRRFFRYDITDELAASEHNLNDIKLTITKTLGSDEGFVTIKNASVLYLD